jgi:2',3'-cyclic-nucleotide 2'-phosphodiesterase (5'-nucleotidase family)
MVPRPVSSVESHVAGCPSRPRRAVPARAPFIPPLLSTLLSFLFILASCSGGATTARAPSAGGAAPSDTLPGVWITLLHTNDIHGAYAARPGEWLPGKPLVGGFKALAGTVQPIRSAGPSILIDAGDLMAGTPLTAIDYRGVPGGGAMAFMNVVGYDAMALGNHEFDLGRDAVEGLIGLADFPILCANLVLEGSARRFAPAGHVILERGGIQVAVVGLILDELATVVAAEPLRGLTVVPAIEAARAAVLELDPQSDLIIAVTHMGLEPSRAIARAVPGIDVIVTGHDHRRTEEPILESGVLVVETGSRLERLGRLDLKVARDQVVDHRFALLDLPAAAGERAPAAVAALYGELDTRIQAEYGKVVAEVQVPLIRDSARESNIGNWITDAFRAATGADFAVTNSTGIRADAAAGPLTLFEIHAISPFPNSLCTFHASGVQLLAFSRKNALKAVGRGGDGEKAIVQVSGLTYSYAPDGAVTDLRVGGRPIEPGRSYLGATSDFIAVSQADKYLGFEPAGIRSSGRLIFDVLCDAAARTSPIAARVEGRMRPLGAAPPAAPPAGGKTTGSMEGAGLVPAGTAPAAAGVTGGR